jgi:uncharacterized Fe-S center protein
MMKSTVYFGSPRQARLDAKETLPAKLDLIIERIKIRERVKDEKVAIKMHVGNHIGYSVIHPVFVRKVVQAVKDGGGQPFVCDLGWDIQSATERGYTAEVLGCPIFPVAGLDEKYYYPHDWEYKNIKTWKVAGLIEDATFLINFAHAKGHPSNGYGGAMKNLALGCMAGETRSAIHDTCHYDRYWFNELCPNEATRQQIMAACPHGALIDDKKQPGNIHLHIEECNQCGRCLKVAPAGSLKIDPVNFYSFQEANAISTAITLSTFAKEKATHLVLATHMTPVCDCFGFTGMPILPDAGIFGSNDIIALEQAVLDETAKTRLIEENLPASMEVHTREGHPFRWLHGPYKDPYKVLEYGEQLGLGSREYELVDVLPVEHILRSEATYIPAH